MTATTAPSQTVLKRLAGGLSFVCLVLLLMAIEQPQTVAAWQAVRHGAAPAVQRAAEALERLPAAWSGWGRSSTGLRPPSAAGIARPAGPMRRPTRLSPPPRAN